MIDGILAITITAAILLGSLGLGRLSLGALPKNHVPQDSIVYLALKTGCGLAGMAFLIWGLGSLGFLNLVPAIIVILATVSIPKLWQTWRRAAARDSRQADHHHRHHQPKPILNRMLMTVLILIAGATMLTTLYPHSHGDPLYYHLSAPWIWSRTGSIHFIDWMPWYLQGGLAEYLYAGIAAGSKDRMTLLLAGQMLHAAVGYGGSIALTVALARKMLSETAERHELDEKFQFALALLAGIAMACFPSELFMLTHAKNDGFEIGIASCRERV